MNKNSVILEDFLQKSCEMKNLTPTTPKTPTKTKQSHPLSSVISQQLLPTYNFAFFL